MSPQTSDTVGRFSSQALRRPGEFPLFSNTAGLRFSRIQIYLTEYDHKHMCEELGAWVEVVLRPRLLDPSTEVEVYVGDRQ